MKCFVETEVVAEKVYTYGDSTTFDSWWDENKDKFLPRNAPTSLVDKFRILARETWIAAWRKCDDSIEAVVVNPFIPRG